MQFIVRGNPTKLGVTNWHDFGVKRLCQRKPNAALRRLAVRTWTGNSAATLLTLTLIGAFAGCGTISARSSGADQGTRLPLPQCPPEEVTLDAGWQPVAPISGSAGWQMSHNDARRYSEWVEGWIYCANARGAVIDAENGRR